MAEMVSYLPISSPFIRFAGRYIDEAFGFAAGWNFFIFEAALVPFEVTACNVIIHFWSDAVPAGGIIAIVLVLYAYAIPLSCSASGQALGTRAKNANPPPHPPVPSNSWKHMTNAWSLA
jgi:yeast amino acid transporter